MSENFEIMRSQRIAELEAEVERLKEAHRWIPTTERPPDECGECLVLHNGGQEHAAVDSGMFAVDTGQFYTTARGMNKPALMDKVTHWQPFPSTLIDYAPAHKSEEGENKCEET